MVFKRIHTWRRPNSAEITFAGENTLNKHENVLMDLRGAHVAGHGVHRVSVGVGVHFCLVSD
jgi:hypothetical protein